jgi:lipopolysaccharide export system permease protein
MDYSTHAKDFITDKHIQLFDIFSYYSLQFIKRADLLLPLANLVATIKVLCSLNAHRELVALQSSGMKLKKLLRPFFFLSFLCTVFNFFSAQYFAPKALNSLDQFKKKHFKQSSKGKIKQRVHLISLKDDTKLFYQTHDKQKGVFFDVIWIPSTEEIWRIKYLKANPKEPMGYFVDHLKQNSQGFFEKIESFDSYLFKQIKWERQMPTKGFIPNENRSLSELFHMYAQKKTASDYEGSGLLTQLYFKLTMPFLSFLAVIAIAPFCVSYSRNIPIFFIYACGLFGFIAFFTFMDAAVIIGENQVLSPFIAILSPFLICGGLFTWKFIKSI